MLAAVDLSNPLLWAVMLGWIMSVVLHEFAHGLVAHLGGDYTIRQRGGLSLNPLQYIDPVNSVLLPIIFLAMGGIPFPGGSTQIRRDLLRSRAWESAVSLAGPLTNFLLFILLLLPFHPRLGWITLDDNSTAANWQLFLMCLALLQGVSVVINLIPIPPLDGFGIISPYLDPQMRQKLTTRQAATVGMLILFFGIFSIPGIFQGIYNVVDQALSVLGYDPANRYLLRKAYNHVLFNH